MKAQILLDERRGIVLKNFCIDMLSKYILRENNIGMVRMSKSYYWFSVKLLFASVAINIFIYVSAVENAARSSVVEVAFVSAFTLVSVLALFQLLGLLFALVQLFYGALELYSFASTLSDGFNVSISTFLQSPLLLILYVMQIALCIVAPAYVLFSPQFRRDFKVLEREGLNYVYFLRFLFVIAVLLVLAWFSLNLFDLIGSLGERD